MKNDVHIMLEALDHKIDLVLEIVAPLAQLPERVDRLETSMGEMRGKMNAVQLAVKDTNSELRELKTEFKD